MSNVTNTGAKDVTVVAEQAVAVQPEPTGADSPPKDYTLSPAAMTTLELLVSLVSGPQGGAVVRVAGKTYNVLYSLYGDRLHTMTLLEVQSAVRKLPEELPDPEA